MLAACVCKGRYLQRPKECVRCPGARIISGCELPDCGSWEPKPSHIQEHPMLLMAEPSLQPQFLRADNI